MSYEIILRYGIGAKNSLPVATDGTTNGLTRRPITYPKKTPMKYREAKEK